MGPHDGSRSGARRRGSRPGRGAWQALLLSLALGLGLAGCGGSDGGSPDGAVGDAGTALPADGGAAPGGNPTPGGTPAPADTSAAAAVAYATNPYAATLAAQPLGLAIETDAATAVTGRVTAADGGTLKATGADGASYELTVPAASLASDLTVTMTPVARFASLPFNGGGTAKAWGVQLEPAGTRFLKPVRLRITPPPGVVVPAGQQLPFGWTDSGVQLALLDPASTQIDLQVLHFSGYAVGQFADGVNRAVNTLRERLGGSPGQRLETVAAERAAARRSEAATGERDAYRIADADFESYFQHYLDEVVRPRIAAASGGCANSRVAFETVLNVQNTLRATNQAPLAWEPFRTGSVEDLMLQVASACLTLESTRCTSEHAVTDIITAVQGIDAEARRVVADPFSANWRNWRANAEARVAQCHRYQLEIDSTSGNEAAGTGGWRFSERMQGTLDLRLSGPVLELSDPIGPKTFEIMGAGPIAPTTYSMAYNRSCDAAVDFQQAPALFTVSRLAFARSADGGLADLRLEYFPGQNPSTHVSLDRCSDPVTQSLVPGFAWSSTFLVSVGSDSRYFGDAGFFLERWIMDRQPVSGGTKTIATHDWEAFEPDGTISYRARTVMRLLHVPVAQ